MTTLNKLVLLSLFAFLFAGCNEYTTQLCSPANMVDVAGLEGNHTVVSYDTDKHLVQKQAVTVTHNGVGSYAMNGGNLSTCAYGNTILGEIANPTHNSFTSYIITTGVGFFDLVLASLDKSEMDAAGIPNQEVTYPNNDKALITDNSKVSGQALVNLLHGTSVVIRVY